MKRLVLVSLLILASRAYAADLTAGVSTESGTRYNKGYREVGNGTNAVTFDNVSANAFALTTGTQNTIKATGGYINSVIINTPCGAGNYVLADAAAGAASYVTVISTWAASLTTAAPLVVPLEVRTSNGIAFNTPFSTCTVTVSYR